ncbi:regulator of microtubule dynamics protein 3-like [Acipenser oxyrinchus oxyrinchus]|uniref:Regulator of microtubule dynamics protein 3 n=1 Tax=Acipenser oxyrinchus oxyrinchus TaxID=40147 RepID=A0AAD8CXJ2_ACIOX|nr:regulator of microtubule dynamics protein 3-like [Acipenser oxyrinchus oxyrinchus]
MVKLGSNAVVGLMLGATAGAGWVIYLIYKDRKKRKGRRLENENSSPPVLYSTVGPHGNITSSARDLESQASQVCAVLRETGGRDLMPEQQVELWNQLDTMLQCVMELKTEVADLRKGLEGIVVQIVKEVKSSVEESQKAARKRRHFFMRERSDSMSSSSIYFSASTGAASVYDGESEGGYTTANAESDYNGETDKETDRDTEEDDDDEEVSCATVKALRRDSLSQDDEDPIAQLTTELPDDEFNLLLETSDRLHRGTIQDHTEGFQLLLSNKPMYKEKKEFLWRLARSYKDMYEITEDKDEKQSYAEQGREEAEAALQRDDQCAECHKWFAVLTGLTSHYESMHGRLKSGNIFKEHIDKAIALKSNDPMCYYLLGRWCYDVSNLGWLERKAASAIYETPPTATVHDALQNFLKTEELSPGYSKTARLYIAKCYKDLGNNSAAHHWAELTSKMTCVSNEDINNESLEEMLETLRE